METRINVAELLKICPEGMELDCAMFESLYFGEITDSDEFPIRCYFKQNGEKSTFFFTKEGSYHTGTNAKCVIFPKGKTTWEGFVPPYQFKDGDVVTCGWNDNSKSYSWTCIVADTPYRISDNYFIEDYCSLDCNGVFVSGNSNADSATWVRLATEEEKQSLFDAIEANGYEWNPETKTLEELEPQYPKTYKECCDILGLNTMANDAQGYKWDLIIRMQELIICRDAYWKFYSEQMRLDYPWQPDYRNGSIKFCIRNIGCKFEMTETIQYNTILAFPTEEMRDAFYVNFKDSIERSKELL